MNEKMTWNDFTETVKEKFSQGKNKASDMWNEHHDAIVGIGVIAATVVGGMCLGNASGKKSMQKEVNKANLARSKAELERDTAMQHLEAELLANESNERLHSIVMLPNGRRMTGAHFVDVVLENAETDELINIVNR